jgi:hypothetical protein
MELRHLLALSALALSIAAACGPAQTTPAAPVGSVPTKVVDICEGSPPVPHPLSGLLRNARCEQDMYWSMAQVADQLGVDCTHCHAPLSTDPKKRDFPVMTPKKEIANWMSAHLMQAIKPADGSPMKCAQCHTDENGKPIAKILGNPRDPVKVNEWMSLVMVKKFVAADGSRLKCKSCHVGTPGTAEFHPKVILQTDQIPPHVAGAKGTVAW